MNFARQRITMSMLSNNYLAENHLSQIINRDCKEETEAALRPTCKQCEYVPESENSLEVHLQTVHQHVKVNLEQTPISMSCGICGYKCDLNIKMKKHMKSQHNQRKKSHTKKKAEHNLDISKEVRSLRKGIKEVIGQLIDEYEHSMQDLKDKMERQNKVTIDAIANLSTQIEAINKPATKHDSNDKAAEKHKAAKKNKTASEPNNDVKKPKKPGKSKPKHVTIYQKKTRVLIIGDSVAHNANFNQIEIVTETTIKTAKAYSAAWDEKARFKHLNITDVAHEEMNKAEFDHLVLAAPTVDISNLETANISSA